MYGIIILFAERIRWNFGKITKSSAFFVTLNMEKIRPFTSINFPTQIDLNDVFVLFFDPGAL